MNRQPRTSLSTQNAIDLETPTRAAFAVSSSTSTTGTYPSPSANSGANEVASGVREHVLYAVEFGPPHANHLAAEPDVEPEFGAR